MANAKVDFVEVEKIVIEKQRTITLTLSSEEAQVLRDIIGGHVVGKFSTRRKLTKSIYDALDPITSMYHENDITGFIEFKEVNNG